MDNSCNEKIKITEKYTIKKRFNDNGKCNFVCMIPDSPENEYLNVQMLGFEECIPSKEGRKHTFEENTLHFILRGKGYFDGIQIGKNDCFMIKKDCSAEYVPDSDTPWSYCWINFDGSMADKLLDMAGLDKNKCTFSIHSAFNIFLNIKSALEFNYQNTDVGMHLNSVLLEIFACLMTSKPDTYSGNTESVSEKRVKRSIEFINSHYKEKTCIDMLAKQENVNKRYLSRLFREHSDFSPQGHLIKIRIDEAKKLLRNTSVSIGSVAESVGYEDVMQFSKIFKKHTGTSPTEYRKSKFSSTKL